MIFGGQRPGPAIGCGRAPVIIKVRFAGARCLVRQSGLVGWGQSQSQSRLFGRVLLAVQQRDREETRSSHGLDTGDASRRRVTCGRQHSNAIWQETQPSRSPRTRLIVSLDEVKVSVDSWSGLMVRLWSYWRLAARAWVMVCPASSLHLLCRACSVWTS